MNVVVFIDAQSVYKDAREAFFRNTSSHRDGQFDPVLLSQSLCGKIPFGHEKVERRLKEVRIYTGVPDTNRDS